MKVLEFILQILVILGCVAGLGLVGYSLAWLTTPKYLWDDRDAGGGI